MGEDFRRYHRIHAPATIPQFIARILVQTHESTHLPFNFVSKLCFKSPTMIQRAIIRDGLKLSVYTLRGIRHKSTSHLNTFIRLGIEPRHCYLCLSFRPVPSCYMSTPSIQTNDFGLA